MKAALQALDKIDEHLSEYERTLLSLNYYSVSVQMMIKEVRDHRETIRALRERLPDIYIFIQDPDIGRGHEVS